MNCQDSEWQPQYGRDAIRPFHSKRLKLWYLLTAKLATDCLAPGQLDQ